MAGALDLYDRAWQLLEVCEDALDQLVGEGLLGSPAREFVSPTEPTFELCDQLSVGYVIVQPDTNQPGGLFQQKVGRVNLVTFLIAVTRCAQQPGDRQALHPSVISAQSRQTYADAWVLWSNIYWRSRNNTLFGDDLCEVRNLQAGIPTDPGPGVIGTLVTFQTQLDGYDSTV